MNDDLDRITAKIVTLVFCLYAVVEVTDVVCTVMMIWQAHLPAAYGFMFIFRYILYSMPVLTAVMIVAIHAIIAHVSERSRFFIFCVSCAALAIRLSGAIFLLAISTRGQYFLLLSANLDSVAIALLVAEIILTLWLGRLRGRNMSAILREDRAARIVSPMILIAFISGMLAQVLSRFFK